MTTPTQLHARSWYIVHPIWDKEKTATGLDTGYEYYEENENPPGWFYPTSGRVIDSPAGSPVRSGDTIYFTWVGFDFKNCISPRKEQNIWGVNSNIYAYKQDGKIHALNYVLLDRIMADQDDVMSDSGLILSGFTIGGTPAAPQILRDNEFKYLHGIIRYLPTNPPLTELFNPYTQKDEMLVPGKKLVVDDCCDVVVDMDGNKLYRTRFFEIMYCYD